LAPRLRFAGSQEKAAVATLRSGTGTHAGNRQHLTGFMPGCVSHLSVAGIKFRLCVSITCRETLSRGHDRLFSIRLLASSAQCLGESRVIDTPAASASGVVAYVSGRQTGSKTSEGKHSIALVASLTFGRIGEHAQKHFHEAPCSLLADGLPSACINHVFTPVRSRTIP
jgi:hypothetical protein